VSGHDGAPAAEPEAADGSARSLGQAALHSARWLSLSRVAVELTAFAGSVVLARLLTPAEFGYAAIVLTLAGLAAAATTQGVGTPLVQAREPTARQLEAAMGASLAVGVTGALTTFLGASLLSSLLGSNITPLLQLMSVIFLFCAVAAVPDAMLQRRLDFRRLSMIDVLAMLASIATALGCAWVGLGAESIVIGSLVLTGTTAALLVAAARPPRPRWHSHEIRELARFGLPACGATLAYTASRNIDYVIVGARLGAAQTGLYYRAYQLGVEYQSKVSGILVRVALPLFSRATDPDELRELRHRIVRLHAVVLLPLLGLLVVIGPTFVPWLYGPPWAGAGELVQWLAVAGMAATIATGTGPLMMATGHPRALWHYNVGSLVVFALVIYMASGESVETVAIVVTLFRIASLLATQYLLVERLVGIRLIDTLRDDVLPASVPTVALIGAAFPALSLLEAAEIPTFLALAGTTIAGLTVYWAVLWLLFPNARADFQRLAKRFLPNRTAAAPAPSSTGPDSSP